MVRRRAVECWPLWDEKDGVVLDDGRLATSREVAGIELRADVSLGGAWRGGEGVYREVRQPSRAWYEAW